MHESKPHSAANESDPEALARSLELELMQKREGWAQAKSRLTALRAISFLFLFCVVIGALVLYFAYFHSDRGNELGTNAMRASPTPARNVTAPPSP